MWFKCLFLYLLIILHLKYHMYVMTCQVYQPFDTMVRLGCNTRIQVVTASKRPSLVCWLLLCERETHLIQTCLINNLIKSPQLQDALYS